VVGGLRGYGDERVVTAVWCVDHSDSVYDTLPDPSTSVTLEDHDNRFGYLRVACGGADPLDERSGGPGSVAPPASGTGSDHVGSVDQKHWPRLPNPAPAAAIGTALASHQGERTGAEQ